MNRMMADLLSTTDLLISPVRKATLIALLSILSIVLREKLKTLLLPENPVVLKRPTWLLIKYRFTESL